MNFLRVCTVFIFLTLGVGFIGCGGGGADVKSTNKHTKTASLLKKNITIPNLKF
ncbi:MAG: hypothetical protein JRJ34_10835 [Deltaproteobacteria bacterium]|nr:hypothetical protein [Deltaproteobacteria bacterium]